MKITKKILILVLMITLITLIGCSNSTSESIPPTNDDLENNIPSDDYFNDEEIIDIPTLAPIEEMSKAPLIEEYLDLIYEDEINQVTYSSYKYINNYYGYIFFYYGQALEVTSSLVSSSLISTRPGIVRSTIDWIVIHDTANNAATATAYAHYNYLTTNPGVSWHYIVDETSVYQNIPDNEVAYHAGDGLRATGTTWYSSTYNKYNNGGGNLNGIGIETCVNSGSEYNQTLMNTASLVADLMIKYNLSIDDVKRHYDFSGKVCPKALIASNRWEEFLRLVEICYYYKTNLYDVQIRFIPLSGELLDNGFILSTAKGSTINYKVVVEYEEKVAEYYYEVKCN